MRMRNLIAVAVVGAMACENSGAERSLSITATGLVSGFVFFDANGSVAFDASDLPFAGARVAILTVGAGDTVRNAITGADGRFRVSGLPVGSYTIAFDATSAGDTAQVVSSRTRVVSIVPDDSATFQAAVGFPFASMEGVATLALGTRVFVTGVALHARDTYSDTTLHVVDTSGAIQATRVRPSTLPIVAGDSVRMRGRVALRLGQRVLDDVTVYLVTPTFIPAIATLATSAAGTASGGTRNAELVRILNAQITDSATVAGNLRLTVNDGSGALVVILDRVSDIAFRAPLPANQYSGGTRYDMVGVLAPTGSGTWQLRPRSSLDLVRR